MYIELKKPHWDNIELGKLSPGDVFSRLTYQDVLYMNTNSGVVNLATGYLVTCLSEKEIVNPRNIVAVER